MTSTIKFNIPFVMEGKVISVNDPDNWPAPTYYEEGCQDSIGVHDGNSIVFTEVDCKDEMMISERKTRNLNFGDVLEGLAQKHKYARRGWNGVGIYIELQVPDKNSKMTQPYIFIVTTGLKGDNPYAPKGHVPWLASQTDMLACDWGEG